jgi:hypothetical protein
MLKSPRKISHRMNRAGYVQVPAPGGADRWTFRVEGKTMRARYAFVRGELTRDIDEATELVRKHGEELLAAQSQEAANVVLLGAKKGGF